MPISNTEGLWITPIQMKRIENEHGWAELRVRYENDGDSTSGYFDIMVSMKKKNQKGKSRIHVILSLGGKILDFQSRGVAQSITQKIESKLKGKIVEESLILKRDSPKLPVDIVLTFNGATKEVTVTDFRFNNSVIFE